MSTLLSQVHRSQWDSCENSSATMMIAKDYATCGVQLQEVTG
ncbi:UNVERIFIED_ORG: hypothetical protein M2193_004950 [Bradyrhizobium japonicum]